MGAVTVVGVAGEELIKERPSWIGSVGAAPPPTLSVIFSSHVNLTLLPSVLLIYLSLFPG